MFRMRIEFTIAILGFSFYLQNGYKIWTHIIMLIRCLLVRTDSF